MGAKATIGASLLSLVLAGAASAEGWTTRGKGAALEAGSTVEGRMAGLRFACPGGRAELRLTHNGASFDRTRAYTMVLSVDGQAQALSMRAVPGGAGDDFVMAAGAGGLSALLEALARGRSVEVSGPAGRYTLPLSGSARAIAAFRRACPDVR